MSLTLLFGYLLGPGWTWALTMRPRTLPSTLDIYFGGPNGWSSVLWQAWRSVIHVFYRCIQSPSDKAIAPDPYSLEKLSKSAMARFPFMENPATISYRRRLHFARPVVEKHGKRKEMRKKWIITTHRCLKMRRSMNQKATSNGERPKRASMTYDFIFLVTYLMISSIRRGQKAPPPHSRNVAMVIQFQNVTDLSFSTSIGREIYFLIHHLGKPSVISFAQCTSLRSSPFPLPPSLPRPTPELR